MTLGDDIVIHKIVPACKCSEAGYIDHPAILFLGSFAHSTQKR